jgi:hydroxymethylpyrimidine pyrophosphatase-like HAD family hydrolase
MLEYSGHPWVVSNASESLKTRFATLSSGNNENSLSELCRRYNLL